MTGRMTEQEACGQAILESDGHASDIKTVHGLIYWLQTIAQVEDVDPDIITNTASAAAVRLKSMQESLHQEVGRIEKLQPFFTDVCAVVDSARKPTDGETG